MQMYTGPDYTEFYANNQWLVSELEKRGIVVRTNYSIQNLKSKPEEPALVDALVASLEHAPSKDYLQTYVGLLRGTKTAYPAAPLIRIFEENDEYPLRSAVLSTLLQSNAVGAVPWLKAILADRGISTEWRAYVAISAFGAENPKEYLPLLCQFYADFPYETLWTFDKSGGVEELNCLRQHAGQTYNIPPDKLKDYQKLFDKVVAKLERKEERQKVREAAKAAKHK